MNTLIRMSSGFEGVYIDSLESLNDYMENSLYEFKSGIRATIKCMRNGNNHIGTRDNEFGAIVNLAQCNVEIHGGMLLKECANVFDQKYESIRNLITSGKRVCINTRGGYCTVNEEFEIVENDIGNDPNIHIHNSKWINMENDPFLEQYTINNLRRIDSFSYVTNAYKFNSSEILSIFKKFVENGGEGLWQYTSASDEIQLKMLCENAIIAGLKKIHIVYNQPLTETLHQMNAMFLKSNDIMFTYEVIKI